MSSLAYPDSFCYFLSFACIYKVYFVSLPSILTKHSKQTIIYHIFKTSGK